MTPRESKKEQVEQLVDTLTLPVLLAMLGEVCEEKADHIRTNWQDEALAGFWDDAASAIVALAGRSAIWTVG